MPAVNSALYTSRLKYGTRLPSTGPNAGIPVIQPTFTTLPSGQVVPILSNNTVSTTTTPSIPSAPLTSVPILSSLGPMGISWDPVSANYFQIFIDGVLFENNVSGSATSWDFSARPPSNGSHNVTMKSFNVDGVGSAFSAPLQKAFGNYPIITGLTITDNTSPEGGFRFTPPFGGSPDSYSVVINNNTTGARSDFLIYPPTTSGTFSIPDPYNSVDVTITANYGANSSSSVTENITTQ